MVAQFLLTDIEHQKLMLGLLRQRKEKDTTPEEFSKLLSWAEVTTANFTILGLLLKGEMLPDMENDDLTTHDDIDFRPSDTVLTPNELVAHKHSLQVLDEEAANISLAS